MYNPDYSKKTPPEIQTKLKGKLGQTAVWNRVFMSFFFNVFLTLTLHILDIWTTASGLKN